MNAIVIYCGKYGSSKQYAKWLAEDLKTAFLDVKEIFQKKENLKQYDVVIYCGGLYAGGILGFDKFQKRYLEICKKKLFVIAVGATLKNDEQSLKKLKNKNLLFPFQENAEFFLLRGALNYQNMKLFDRFLMFLLGFF